MENAAQSVDSSNYQIDNADNINSQESAGIPPFIPNSSSPLKKIILLIIIFIIFVFIILGILAVLKRKSLKNNIPTTPTPRPTATPISLPPTIPMNTPPIVTPHVTQNVTQTLATPTPIPLGRLAFIKDGDIYHSDFTSYSLLSKNEIPAGDKLSWSTTGDFLAWRPKLQTATPSALTVYNRKTNIVSTIETEIGNMSEIIDYSWSPSENKVVILSKDDNYKISLYDISSSKTVINLVTRKEAIYQVIWVLDKKIIFTGTEGIISLDSETKSNKILVSSNSVYSINISPDRKKILYSIGDFQKSNLYIVNPDGTDNRLLASHPAKVEMGNLNISEAILDDGFLPYAVWFTDSKKLLVAYRYLKNLPIVGIYYLDEESVKIIGPFTLKKDDFMIDEFRLIGTRVNTTSQTNPFWQLIIFTLEDNSNLGMIRVIPQAVSPSFFTKESF